MRDKPSSFSGNIPWTRVEDVQGKYLGASLTGLCVSTETVQKMHLQVFPKDSIAVTISATFGVVAITTRDIVTNQRFIGLVPNKGNDVDFLYELCKSPTIFKQMKIESAGSVHFYITRHQMENFRVNVPAFAEQLKMSGLLNTLDKVVALHERKLNLLKRLKRAYLQQLFPENGQKIPSLRFTGFADDWEQRKLSTLYSNAVSGGTPLSGVAEYYNGNIPFLSISDLSNSDGQIKKTAKYISESGLKNSAATIVPAGTVALAMYASVGKVGVLSMDAATSQAFFNMSFQDDAHRDLVYQALIKYDVESTWRPYISTGTQANLNAKKVSEKSVDIPRTHLEIKKITNLLGTMDHIVALHQRELEKLYQLKKAYLQKLFV